MEIEKNVNDSVSALAIGTGTGEVIVTYVPIVKRYSFVIIGEQVCTGYVNGTSIPVCVSDELCTTVQNGITYWYTKPIRTSFPYVYNRVTYLVNVRVQPIDFSKY